MRNKEIKKLVKAHHGIPDIVNAFALNNNVNNRMKNLVHTHQIIVMVQNLNKHETSYALRRAIKNNVENQTKFAISNSAGLQSIEAAIYRADVGLPAYEASSNTIKYPILK